MIFVRFLGSQNCLPDEKMSIKKALPDMNLAPKKALPDGNWALKYHYRIGEPNSRPVWIFESHPVMIFGSQVTVQKSLFESHFLVW